MVCSGETRALSELTYPCRRLSQRVAFGGRAGFDVVISVLATPPPAPLAHTRLFLQTHYKALEAGKVLKQDPLPGSLTSTQDTRPGGETGRGPPSIPQRGGVTRTALVSPGGAGPSLPRGREAGSVSPALLPLPVRPLSPRTGRLWDSALLEGRPLGAWSLRSLAGRGPSPPWVCGAAAGPAYNRCRSQGRPRE